MNFIYGKRNRSVGFWIRLYSISFTAIAIFIIGLLYFFLELRDFDRISEENQERYIREQKGRIRTETNKVIDYIEITRMFLDEKMRTQLIRRCNEAWSTMDVIYRNNHHHLSESQIRALIKDALRPIRFFNGRGYYFIVNIDGTEELYPVAPQYEGKNLIGLQDIRGNYVIQDEIRIIKESGSGFVTDYWTKPNTGDSLVFPKTSFIKYYEPLNWYVGCGEYLDNFDRDAKEDIKKRIQNIRFGKDGYIFVDSYSGHAVVINSNRFNEGDYIGDLKDRNGIYFVHKQKQAALQEDGGFVKYAWVRPGSNEQVDKLSYVKAYKDWEWVIGAGVYLDEIDQALEKEKTHLYQQLRIKYIGGISVLLCILVLILIIANKASLRINRNFTEFNINLKKALAGNKLLKKEDYNISNIQSIAMDINDVIEKKLFTEKLLKESEERFRTIFKNAPVMILILDAKMNLLLSNESGKEIRNLFGASKFNLASLEGILPTTDGNKEFLKKAKEFDGKFREVELKIKNKTLHQNWAAFNTKAGEIILVGYDISEIRNNEKRLKELNNTKDKYFSIISHDLQGPFNSLIGFSDLLLEDYYEYDDKERIGIVKKINNSSQSMHRLLVNLLHWARSQSGKIIVRNESFSLYDLVQEVFNICNIQASEKAISLINNTKKDHLVIADISMCNTIIRNLVSNSIKFTNKRGLIEVSSKQEADKIIVCVKDSGIGIEEKNIPRLFMLTNEKQRLGTKNESGTGLGLIICKDFVEKMNGRIWVESIINEGSSFFFSLTKDSSGNTH